MRCGNTFCIYWKDGNCVLKNIELDIQGSCISCIYVDLDEEMLRKMRTETINRLEMESDEL